MTRKTLRQPTFKLRLEEPQRSLAFSSTHRIPEMKCGTLPCFPSRGCHAHGRPNAGSVQALEDRCKHSRLANITFCFGRSHFGAALRVRSRSAKTTNRRNISLEAVLPAFSVWRTRTGADQNQERAYASRLPIPMHGNCPPGDPTSLDVANVIRGTHLHRKSKDPLTKEVRIR